MKREGRQHGMVRTYIKPGNQNGPSSAPIAGQFSKVSTKPTNHSKFTGKCARPMCRQCHVTPACKSMDKVKGTQKLCSWSDYRSNTWTVVGGDEPGSKYSSGFSATDLLDYYLGSNDDFLCEDD
ncbi:hypothetical protein ACP275_08G004600 [Erythranthe tilingii]